MNIMRSIGKWCLGISFSILLFGIVLVFDTHAHWKPTGEAHTNNVGSAGFWATTTQDYHLVGLKVYDFCKKNNWSAEGSYVWLEIFNKDTNEYVATSVPLHASEIDYGPDYDNCDNEVLFGISAWLYDEYEYEIQVHRSTTTNNFWFSYGTTTCSTCYTLVYGGADEYGEWETGLPDWDYYNQMEIITLGTLLGTTTEFDFTDHFSTGEFFDHFSAWSGQFIDYDKDTYCYIGEDCEWWFSYKESAFDYWIYIVDNESDTLIDFTQMERRPFAEDYLEIHDYWSPTIPESKQFYIVVRDENSDVVEVKRDIWIHYVSDLGLLDFCGEWDCDCSEISTSTFDVAGNIQCAFNRTLCWSLCPSNASTLYLRRQLGKTQNIFPFSVVEQIKMIFNSETYATSTSKLTLNFANILNGGSGTSSLLSNFDNDLVLASSTTMEDTFGTLWTDYLYEGMEWFIYLTLFFYFVARFIGLAKRSNTEETITEGDLTETKDIETWRHRIGGKQLVDRKSLGFKGKSRSKSTRFRF